MFNLSGINIQSPPVEVSQNTIIKRSFSEIVKGGLRCVSNIPAKISHCCSAICHAPPVRAGRIIGMPNINITQCGPQCHVNGYDLKFTWTNTCTTQAISCFPVHGEVGYYIGQASVFNFYFLSVHQYGFKVEHNGSIDPREWGCSAAAEKLEHQEATIPYLKFGDNTLRNGNYSGSVQFLMAMECGKTTTIPAGEIKKRVTELFCATPTAFPELIYQVCKNHWQKNSDASPPVITEQPRANTLFAHYHAGPHLPDIEEKAENNGKDSTFWFGLTIGPGDVNSAVTWGTEGFSFSLQLTNYPRKNFMFTWKEGKFNPPENIAELIEIVTALCQSRGNTSQQIEHIIAHNGSLSAMQPDETMRQQAEISITEFARTLQNALSADNEPRHSSSVAPLATARQSPGTLTIAAEISAAEQQEESGDEVMPAEIRPRASSQLRKRTRSVFDVSEVSVNMAPAAEEDGRQRSNSMIARKSQPLHTLKSSQVRDNREPAEEDAFRPRSQTLEGRKKRLPSEHSD